MTASVHILTLLDMARGRPRGTTKSEFYSHLAERVRVARESTGLNLKQMAEALERKTGRPLSADTYRKYESGSARTAIRHEFILAFCDLTETHPFELLRTDPRPFVQRPTNPAERRRPAA